MALDQYLEEAVPQINSFKDKSSLEMWQCSSDDAADSDRNASGFDCNICLECVQDPVVTLCGHLYCWPCIYKWLNSHSISSENEEKQNQQCPVCKSEISQSSLVPLYGRGQTSVSSEGKGHQVGIVVPRRPSGPSWVANSARSLDSATISQPTSQLYHHHYRHQPQQFNSVPGSYTSSMFNTGGSLTNAFDTTYGVFGEMIYARVFGNQMTNIYTYPNSYDLSGSSNPRIRRHLMQVDRSLSRICFFLLCCIVLCLLLF
ncbi:E3 ubiquitin-protein ligase RMA1H1-like [Abrus precatorius]|uniref:E3 ubiquitin-protein ligase RMA n=1 Tax=Abrus precatorius TaxID=3816 RepID=A0A8B8KBU7_ABRPR|nr:E3 ubiquitin-protein ligase RMA1H1-like [Abrus precatorius]XP_027341202.1 E3 ubiquitin-protein ligase RMA1H1-like [Abrus precatorius]XP_027341203.1 E3 ubiquitin-protein ligase RMA1H1-like [Abrus precatorius]XP_027341204.1 E3 ubiquitin-protein ligase RMA1H1-like [Abrus precatorius]XP_027341205.1 E3 ubiquitin-protein ligase RMA1H1-like [Abrus precatorius]XP_027341206.1 E3 ubiquitin-protein ligase RMA1H1-like [Abrus precatorius]